MANNFPWTCPYCSRAATITESNCGSNRYKFQHGNKDGDLLIETKVIVCPNPDCKEYAVSAALFKAVDVGGVRSTIWEPTGQPLAVWHMKPRSRAKTFPSYIPKAVLEDYEEACLIRDASPKASATLSRRCLQGIIRDFHGISKSRLVDEIDALNGKIDPLVWHAIDAVRSIGNIGAHMERDINLIIDVEPQEASALIGLIEMLLKDWYIDRHEKEKQLKAIVQISQSKQDLKNNTTSNTP